ncbi:MAG: leucine--tRNA ligase [Ignisphaera sp.]|nr:leucine--tRNA ligase [Ignisphaera sp.]MCX8168128.1 leucine--tRNA ligase [Ignisphaera sp.]MDW8085437.1 leucine--tRNA ligase [Ignisphaera sp.]
MEVDVNKYFVELSIKWSEKWLKEKVFEAESNENMKKYFITAAFMYPNGPVHIGHGRTYLIADIIARFKRFQGYNTLFPMGFHYTGTPIISMAEAIAGGDKELIELFRGVYEVSDENIEKMSDPLYLARYFHGVSKETMCLFGLSIDWRREFTTIDPEFKSFIHWQFLNLYEKGLIEKGTHPVGWCPRHEMPVGMHDTKGDVEPEIGEFIAIFFRDESNVLYPAATLRPETVFGVTNLWVNPDEMYLEIRTADGSIWIIGEKAGSRLRYQLNFEVVRFVKGSELSGVRVRNPITGEEIPVFPAKFVDASFATGIVMSVPAHAPYDAIALEELKADPSFSDKVFSIKPRIIIETSGKRVATAYEILKTMNIKSQEEKEKLDEATKAVYASELQSGCMLHDLHDVILNNLADHRKFVESNVSGSSVKEARERIRSYVITNKLGVPIYELINKPVYCRCGTEIVVKILQDQWFINYGDDRWKSTVKEWLRDMKIVPQESIAQFEATIDWLKRRACARTRGLGVPLPWDSRWIIESLSDSTIYMAFYTVIHKLREYGIDSSKLTREFWDYVFVKKGSVEELSHKLNIPVEVLEKLNREFEYWYPLDARISGKDLIPNHLTFFVFNHLALFPRRLCPKGIVANGWVLVRQQKMSKSARNIIPLKKLITAYGADVVRLLLALNAEVHQDENIDQDMLEKLCKNEYPQLLQTLSSEITELFHNKEKLRSEMTIIDEWFWNEFVYRVQRIISALEEFRIRDAGISIYYDLRDLIRTYIGLVGTPSRKILDAIRIWLGLINIYTPFIAEEIWSKTFLEGMLANKMVDVPREVDVNILLAFRYANMVIDAINNIIKATKRTQVHRVVIYVAPRDSQVIMRRVLEEITAGVRPSEIIDKLSKELKMDKKSIGTVLKALHDIATTIGDDIKELYLRCKNVDELELLTMAQEYIVKKVRASVEVYSAADAKVPDLGSKKKVALPLRPGIYIE